MDCALLNLSVLDLLMSKIGEHENVIYLFSMKNQQNTVCEVSEENRHLDSAQWSQAHSVHYPNPACLTNT